MKLSQAYETFILYKQASGLSDNTIANYRKTWQKVRLFFHSDPAFETITNEDWLKFLAWAPEQFDLCPKSMANVHTDLSSLYTWATEMSLVSKHLIRNIPRPKYEKPAIDPYTKEHVAAMLEACNSSSPWNGREHIRSSCPMADRNRAILLTLLSSGMRASELCGIRLADLDLGSNKITIAGKGRGRDSKQRIVFIGRRTTKAIWKLITPHISAMYPTDPVFSVGSDDDQRTMTRDVLSRLVRRIGERASVKNAYPHRFRHTFAINYLRNGGDAITLQRLLGHESLEMVRHYVELSSEDCGAIHKTADPVDNWRL